jgi:nucleoside-diphosphate-sugar epimerase
MNYLVLGSSGQVGSHLAEYLRKLGHTVIEFDNVKNCYDDLRWDGAVDRAMEQADFVFFLAFDVGGSLYLKTYQHTFDFVDNNTRLMLHTFNALRKCKKPFIFASSQMSNMTFSSYGTLKALGEYYTRTLNGLFVKFWNVYGIEHDPAKTHVITDFIQMALKNGQIKMRTDGTEERQFLYAEDCSKALYILSQQYNKIPRDAKLDITSFEWITVMLVAQIISQICNGAEIVSSINKDNVQQGQKNEPDKYLVNSDIWFPETSIKDGISKIIEYEKSSISV